MSEEINVIPELNRDYIKQNSIDQELIAQLRIDVNDDLFENESANSHIIFLLDASSSMDQKIGATGISKRQTIIDTVETLLPSIGDDDEVSVILFESTATIIDRKIPGTEKDRIKSAVQKLRDYNGATNFESGMNAVKKVVGQNFEESSIIFLTDGYNYTGNENNAKLIAEEISNQGASITAMGIGDDFNFDNMRIYSSYSNSETELIKDSDKAKEVFENVIDNAQGSVIKKVKLNIAFASGIRDLEVFSQTPEIKFLNSSLKQDNNGNKTIELNMGNLSKYKMYNYIIKMNVDVPDTHNMNLAELFLTYTVPSNGNESGKITSTISVNLSDNEFDEETDSDIDKSYKDVSIEKLHNDFIELGNKGEWLNAAKKLKAMIVLADEIGDNAKELEYKKKLKKLENNNHLSQDELNELAYASSTSSVFARGVKDDADDDFEF